MRRRRRDLLRDDDRGAGRNDQKSHLPDVDRGHAALKRIRFPSTLKALHDLRHAAREQPVPGPRPSSVETSSCAKVGRWMRGPMEPESSNRMPIVLAAGALDEAEQRGRDEERPEDGAHRDAGGGWLTRRARPGA